MISIIATRNPGDKQGADIIDNLLTAEPAAIERGRNEIDKVYSNRETVTGSGPIQSYLAPGSIVEVMDMEAGPWRGMVTAFSISISRGDTELTGDTNMTIERKA